MISGRAQRSLAHGEVSELNLSQAVIALATGPIKPDCNRDMLLIGSPTQILGKKLNQLTSDFMHITVLNNPFILFTAYDVHDNSDLFFKEAPDGVNVIIVGYFGKYKDILVIVGGNSSVLALNWEGTEHFWNVVTGKVCSMIILDFDKDGENEVSKGFT